VTNTYLHRTFSNRRGYLHRNTDQDGAGPSGTHHNDDDNISGDSDAELDDDNLLSQEDDAEEFMDDSEGDNYG
jgi:hypothetical protein